jgi:raffinose/stachyose/melibiose transport system permease protein
MATSAKTSREPSEMSWDEGPGSMRRLLQENWWVIALRGIIGIIFGLIALFLPGVTILSLVLVFAAYMLVDGAFSIAGAIRARGRNDQWGWLLLNGIISIITAILAFLWPLITAVAFVLLSLVLQLPFALALAMILNARLRGRGLLRVLFFAPFVLSEVVTGVIWTLILQPRGLADASLERAGLDPLIHQWLADPGIVLYTLFVVISWKYFGFHMILYLAGLQQIPRELEEAAEIDGATKLQVIRYVTLPLLGPTIRVSAFLSIIGALQLFDLIWVMTGGGPVNASNTMATYLIDWSFQRFQFGYASAVAVILLVISLLFALLYQRFVLRRDIEGALTTMGAR